MTMDPQPVDDIMSNCAGIVPGLAYTSIPLIASGRTESDRSENGCCGWSEVPPCGLRAPSTRNRAPARKKFGMQYEPGLKPVKPISVIPFSIGSGYPLVPYCILIP